MELVGGVPSGFRVNSPDENVCVIEYRTSGMGYMTLFLAAWLTGWSVACVLLTGKALLNKEGVDYLLLLFMLPFWYVLFFVGVYFVWFVWSTTQLRLGVNELVAERTLFGFRRSRVFAKGQIIKVRQVKDGGEGPEDGFPSWGLVLVGERQGKVLSRQPFEKSEWLGPVIAKWAGVEFEPEAPPKRENIKSL